jgi:hypothetical protein
MPAAEQPAPQPTVEGAATQVREPSAYGPLGVARFRKEDGRTLILYVDAREPAR